MKRGPQGTWVKRTEVEAHRAFVPHALPPVPAIDFASLAASTERANRALGRLDGVSMMLPDPKLFLSFCVRKEAVRSSQLSGTQTSLSDLLLSELGELPAAQQAEAQEVSRCVEASDQAMNLLRGGLPLSTRFIREVHEVLLPSSRTPSKQPGGFRRAPVWMGGASPAEAIFVAPPWNEVARCMFELENSLDDPNLPTLIKAALVHAQFETIHPFLEGNGRIGRVLISVMLVREKALSEPWLSLSQYFRQHRQQYVNLLQATRETGEWEAWLEFFLHAVEVTAEYAQFTARKMLALFAEHEERIARIKGPARRPVVAVYRQLQQRPIADLKTLSTGAGTKPPSTLKALERLIKLGIARRQGNRLFSYTPLVDLLQNDLPL